MPLRFYDYCSIVCKFSLCKDFEQISNVQGTVTVGYCKHDFVQTVVLKRYVLYLAMYRFNAQDDSMAPVPFTYQTIVQSNGQCVSESQQGS